MRLAPVMLALLGFITLAIIGSPILLVRPGTAPPAEFLPLPLVDDFAAGLPIRVYVSENPEPVVRPLEEYVKEVVAAEMPALFHPEALKAQATVARTYAVARMRMFGGSGCDRHPEADVCAGPAEGQAWQPREEQINRWGSLGYSLYWRKIDRAVSETRGLIVVYQGAPIDAVFHAASGGRTEDAENVWGNPVPYLRSVQSPYEKGIKYDNVRVEIPLGEVAERLDVSLQEINRIRGRGLAPFAVLDRTASGRAAGVRVGNKVISGRELRQALELNSTLATLNLEGDRLIILTSGYGHGVGLSQYGADGLARSGKNFREIIQHFYKGVSVRSIFVE